MINGREGIIGPLRTPSGEHIFPLVPNEDFREKSKQEKIHGGPQGYTKITENSRNFIGGAIKREDRMPWGLATKDVLLGTFMREAKKEYGLDIHPDQISDESGYLAQIDQIRNSEEIFFYVWFLGSVVLYPSQISQLERSLIEQRKNQPTESIQVVSPGELARYLEENQKIIRPVAHAAALQVNMQKWKNA